MYVSMYVCLFIYVCVCVCVCIHTHTHTHVRETGLLQKKKRSIIADGQVTIPQDKDNAEHMTQNYYKNI